MWRDADRLLQGEEPAQAVVGRLALLSVLGCLIYGAVMGSFGVVDGDRLPQVLYSSVKVPILLLVTFALSLPSFFVMNTLLGVRADFGRVLRALLGSQAGLALVLMALAPFTLFWYASFTGYHQAVLFNGLMFGVASLAAGALLRRWYRPLIAANPVHRWLLRMWIVLYAFVGIQMGWVLRPFIGLPHSAVQFFRDEAWGNAYIKVGEMIWRVIVPPS